MGRSRRGHNLADDDVYQRSRKRKAASSGDNSETMATVAGTSEGKKVMYHCNYCNKDITGMIRIKCSKCTDFDLCVECHSVGAEITPHKSIHPYRVMHDLSFPLISPDWNADEEILLLEGLEMYGLGNWAEIVEHVGIKSKDQCMNHYTTAYLKSPCYPLPEMSHLKGKNSKECSMDEVQGECMKEVPILGTFSPSRHRMENLCSEVPAGRSPSNLTASSSKKASNMGHFMKVGDSPSAQDPCIERRIAEKKPKNSGMKGPVNELSGYNHLRHEFDPEYDNDAEKVIADMEFRESDSETERELKLRMLRIYLSRIDERKRRKDFILERNLLYPDPLEKELSSEDREIYQRFKVFMRFLSQEQHESLVKTTIEEHNLRRRIQELQECRDAGCRTVVEARVYTEQKRKRESEGSTQKIRQSVASKAQAKANRATNREKTELDGSPESTLDDNKGSDKDSASTITGPTPMTMRPSNYWDINVLPGSEWLSKADQQLCRRHRLMPSCYLKMQEVLMQEAFKGTVVHKSDARRLFRIEPNKVDVVYDVVMKKMRGA